jgi:hypothetical protein
MEFVFSTVDFKADARIGDGRSHMQALPALASKIITRGCYS